MSGNIVTYEGDPNYPSVSIECRRPSQGWGDAQFLQVWIVINLDKPALIARFMGPTWGPSGADRPQVGPMLAPWTFLSGRLTTYYVAMIQNKACNNRASIPCPLSGRTSYSQISWNIEAARLDFWWSYLSAIWQASQQRCFQCACHISDRLEMSKYESRSFETSRYFHTNKLIYILGYHRSRRILPLCHIQHSTLKFPLTRWGRATMVTISQTTSPEICFQWIKAWCCIYVVSRGKMEHGGKMEHRLFGKKNARRGSIFRSTWFLSSANSASYIEIELFEYLTKRFEYLTKLKFHTFDKSTYSHFDINCFDELSSRTVACGWI